MKKSVLGKILSCCCIFGLVPLLVVAGVVWGNDRQYLLISFLIVLAALVALFLTLEHKISNTRTMILIAVMTAMSVLGRNLFAFVPFFKPVSAIVILTAVYFGSEAGFLCGALSALLSNMTFGQGPWTPFQMLAWGLIGMIAGFLAGPLRQKKMWLFVYGFCAGIFFSIIMDVWAVLWAEDGSFAFSRYVAALTTALPVMTVYAVSNVIFLAVFLKLFGNMLMRLQAKYGIGTN